jgi:hypothetical protein
VLRRRGRQQDRTSPDQPAEGGAAGDIGVSARTDVAVFSAGAASVLSSVMARLYRWRLGWLFGDRCGNDVFLPMPGYPFTPPPRADDVRSGRQVAAEEGGDATVRPFPAVTSRMMVDRQRRRLPQ